MKLQTKVLTLLTVTWIVVLLLIFFGFRTSLINNYIALEHQEIKSDLKLVDATIKQMLESLQGHAGDWAHWDDAYKFMDNRNQSFITSNMKAASSYEDTGIDMILFFNNDKKFYYGQAYNQATKKYVAIPKSLFSYLSLNQSSFLFQHNTTTDAYSGIIKLPEGYLLLSSTPVTTSNNMGPIHGSLIMAYYLNKARLQHFSKITQLPISLFPVSDNPNNSILKSAELQLKSGAQYVSIPSNINTIYGFSYLKDINGNPIAIIRLDSNRFLYQQGVHTINNYLLIMITLGIIISILMWFSLKVFFLDRLLHVNKQITDISISNEFSKRLKINGNDEISSITKAINSMLEIIELTQEQLKHRLFQSTDELTKLSTLNKNLSLEIEQHRNVASKLLTEDQELRQLVYYDTLTSLPNRIFLYEFLDKIIHSIDCNSHHFAILFLDIDKFKQINDKHGHEIGNKFLKFVADQLKNTLKDEDLASRIAGDEFIIYLNDIKNIDEVVTRILKNTSKPLILDDLKIESTISIGISLFPQDATTVSELENHADLAMYMAKKDGGNSYHYYQESKTAKIS